MIFTEEIFGIVYDNVDKYDLMTFKRLHFTCHKYLKYSKYCNKNNKLFMKFSQTYQMTIRDFFQFTSTNTLNVLQKYLQNWYFKPEHTNTDIMFTCCLYKFQDTGQDIKKVDLYVLYNVFISNHVINEYSYTLDVKKLIFECIFCVVSNRYSDIVNLLENFQYLVNRSELNSDVIEKYFCSDTNLWQMFSNQLNNIDLSDDDIQVSILIGISYFMFVSVVYCYNKNFIKNKMFEYINFSIHIFQHNLNGMEIPIEIKTIIIKKLDETTHLLYTYKDE